MDGEIIDVKILFPQKFIIRTLKDMKTKSEKIGKSIAEAALQDLTKTTVKFDYVNPIQMDALVSALQLSNCKVSVIKEKDGTYFEIDFSELSSEWGEV